MLTNESCHIICCTDSSSLRATNERLQEKAVDIRRSLTDLELTEAQYHELRVQPEDELALKDFVAVRSPLRLPFISLLTFCY